MKGRPLFFRCAKERKEYSAVSGDGWQFPSAEYRHTAARTGAQKRNPSFRHGALDIAWQYRCSCGHVGWSTHRGVLNLPMEGGDA